MNSNFVVDPDSINLEYSANRINSFDFYMQGYTKVLGNRPVDRDKLPSLFEKCTKQLGMIHHDLGRKAHILYNDKCMFQIDKYNFCGMQAKTYEDLEKLQLEIKEFLRDDKKTFNYIYMSAHELEKKHIDTQALTKRIIPEMYPNIDIALLREQFDAAPEKILILYGDPGVGKTTFIHYLINDGFYESVAYVKDEQTFSSNELWIQLTEDDYELVIFDDVDNILSSRDTADQSKANFVSQLLSYSDGVIKRKTKVVMTTNQEISEIDPAIIRPGRCFDFLVLRPLTYDEAKIIWTKSLEQNEASFTERFTANKDITQAALMSEYAMLTQSSISRSYIKGEDRRYSVREKLEKLGINSGKTRSGFGR